MTALPAETATLDCLATLRVLGFRLEGSDADHVTLRGPTGRRVLVPQEETLDANVLATVLLFGGVAQEIYLRAFGHVASGEFPMVEADSGIRATLLARWARSRSRAR